MMHKGAWGPAGTLIPIELAEGDQPTALKRKVAAKTGIPVESQKMMLGAFTQITVGDKRSSLRFGTCGRTEGLGLALEAAVSGQKPHVPPATANRVDNSGARPRVAAGRETAASLHVVSRVSSRADVPSPPGNWGAGDHD